MASSPQDPQLPS